MSGPQPLGPVWLDTTEHHVTCIPLCHVVLCRTHAMAPHSRSTVMAPDEEQHVFAATREAALCYDARVGNHPGVEEDA